MNTFYSKNYSCWPPVHNRDMVNPNSSHWEQQARLAQRRLADLLGPDDFRLWAEITWPGESIDGQSWQEIFKTCQLAIDAGEAVIRSTFACGCSGDWLCQVCSARERIQEMDGQNG